LDFEGLVLAGHGHHIIFVKKGWYGHALLAPALQSLMMDIRNCFGFLAQDKIGLL
jgi:hypothetical protein